MNCLHIAGIVQQSGITLHGVHIRFWEVSAECRLILQKIWEENLWTEAAVHLIVGVCIIQVLLCLWMALSALKKRLINHLHVYVGGTYCNNTCSSINSLYVSLVQRIKHKKPFLWINEFLIIYLVPTNHQPDESFFCSC